MNSTTWLGMTPPKNLPLDPYEEQRIGPRVKELKLVYLITSSVYFILSSKFGLLGPMETTISLPLPRLFMDLGCCDLFAMVDSFQTDSPLRVKSCCPPVSWNHLAVWASMGGLGCAQMHSLAPGACY